MMFTGTIIAKKWWRYSIRIIFVLTLSKCEKNHGTILQNTQKSV